MFFHIDTIDCAIDRMDKPKPLDYYADYYRDKPGLYELPVEAHGYISNDIRLRQVTSSARFLMLRHEREIYDALENFVEGKWALVAQAMSETLKANPAHNDARVLATLSHYLSGRTKQALETILPGLEVNVGYPMGRYFKAWMPSLRVLVRLDYDLAVPFYPNRLGMYFLAISAHRELGQLQEAGLLLEAAANEYSMIDEMLYIASLLHLQMGHSVDAWALLGARTYKNTDSLDIGITMLRAETMLHKFSIDRAISEYRAALQFVHGRSPWLLTRARWRLAELYRIGEYKLDEQDVIKTISKDFLPAHFHEQLDAMIKEIPEPSPWDDYDGDNEMVLDPSYPMRFDYVMRGKKERDQQVEFLEI